MKDFLKKLGISETNLGGSTGQKWYGSEANGVIEVYSPTDGEFIAKVNQVSTDEYNEIIEAAQNAFKEWRKIPAPKRGELVRQAGMKLREFKQELGMLVSYEMGKSLQEGLGEVQEMIDICDFAVGLSRQLYGLTMHSERPSHRMYEQYHPLGIVGVISAFNFPVAVWSWNSMLAAVCGDSTVWKPSSKTPLCAVAVQNIMNQIEGLPEGLLCTVIGRGATVGEEMLNDKRIPLISATGSTRMGKRVAEVVGKRLGRSLLELGGNNAIIISEEADLKMAVMAAVFGAVGTAGQRCTSTRRLIIQEGIYDKVKDSLLSAYESLTIGDPLDEKNHVGPLIDKSAVDTMQEAIVKLKEEGGKVIYGGEVLEGEGYESGCYVRPCIAEAENSYEIVQEETFAPILYLMKYKTMDEAVELHNGVAQGLSSAIFTKNMLEAEHFLSHWGSDCGIANVNIGTSGAEIGGAFGGEKETGGGRESGSDAWKIYMRRQTNTLNFGKTLPLAQGIKFNF